MTELPVNCVLNKGITGCGATTLAIEQKGDTIIAMPYVGLIENKMKQHSDTLLGIYGEGDKRQEIEEYLKTHEQVKIATTYDSLPKVCRILSENGHDPYRQALLVIDEWHVLFLAYCYRRSAIRGLLNESSMFERKTYISATPIKRTAWVDGMQTLDEITIEWPEVPAPTIEPHSINDPIEAISRICRGRIINGGDSNYHIFLNSVKGIASIVRRADLKPENVRVVCSANSSSGNQYKLPDGFRIADTSQPVKDINFYTSTCFEGQDIYDENGRIFIVSDQNNNNTKLDISTSIIQIIGRIRNSKYANQAIQLYSDAMHVNDESYEDFADRLNTKIRQSRNNARYFNMLEGEEREFIFKNLENMNRYLTVENDEIIVDETMKNLELYHYFLINTIYGSQNNLEQAYRDNNFIIGDCRKFRLIKKNGNKISSPLDTFESSFIRYSKLKKEESSQDWEIERIEHNKPLVKKAYEILGEETVKSLKYSTTKINRAIIKVENRRYDREIAEALDSELPKQEYIPLSKIKNKLQEVYDDFGIAESAKATDIKK